MYFETIGHSSKNSVPSKKTLRPSWCPKLVTGLYRTAKNEKGIFSRLSCNNHAGNRFP